MNYTNACAVPIPSSSIAERRDYLVCRANSLAYHAAELAADLDRMSMYHAAKGARGITKKLLDLRTTIQSGSDAPSLL